MAFHAIYIREAHPTDVWQMASNVREGVLFRDPRTESERTGVAESCVRKLGIRFPALVDGVTDAVEREYTGWPDRMYLIGTDGRVIYKSQPGPFGFHPKELERALRSIL